MSEETEVKGAGNGEGEGHEVESQTKQTQSTETEDKARRMGWVPKDEFKGDPAKWRPADEFVARGENEMPILRERLRHQDKQLTELRDTIKQFAEYHSKVEQNAYKKALTDLKAQQAQAVAAGDAQAFSQIGEQIEELTESAKQINVPKLVEHKPEDRPEFKAWKTRNVWYGDDMTLTKYADKIGEFLFDTKGLEGESLFEEVSKRVKREFPEKFENPRRAAASSVEGAVSAPKKAGKTYADLPAEAKAACDRFVKEGFTTKESYVKRFFEDQE